MRNFIFIISLLSSQFCLSQHSVRALGSGINTQKNEICPILSYDEKLLFFTREGDPDFIKTLFINNVDVHETLTPSEYLKKLRYVYSLIAGRHIEDPSASSFNQDVWFSHKNGEEIHPPTHADYPLNDALPNSICSNMSKDNEYVVINQFSKEGGIEAGFSRIKFENGSSSFPEPIYIKNFDKKGSEINLTMSNDGQQIILAMTANGVSDMDLYLSLKLIDGYYSVPFKLENGINTNYRETTPYISQDKKRLYFASNRPGGYGGLDIYYCERKDYSYKNWSEPILLGQPLNTEYNDSHPYITIDETTIYFTSDRNGNSDIFTAKLIRDDKLPQPISIDINVFKEDSTRIRGEINWVDAYTGENGGFFIARDGTYRFTFKENIPTVFYAINRGYRSDTVLIDPQDFINSGKTSADLFLVMSKNTPKRVVRPAPKPDVVKEVVPPIEDEILPVGTNKTIVLKNIYFERAKANVLTTSYPALEKLARVLNRKKNVHIRIEGHTDNVGDDKSLKKLSQMRANAIKEFLVDQGVEYFRITTVGYGDTRPLTDNLTESQRRKNRRVEIRVMKD